MPIQLQDFEFERVLDKNPYFRCLNVLGTLPASSISSSDASSSGSASDGHLPAILRLERTPLPLNLPQEFSSGVLEQAKTLGNTDIYTWMNGWLKRRDDLPDLKISVICPATDAHIRKYSKQDILMVHETPELYEKVVKPYIEAFPLRGHNELRRLSDANSLRVRNILDGTSEAQSLLHFTDKFLVLPDMKWDPTTSPLTALYLLALVRDTSIRSMRDLRGGESGHLPLLKAIRDAAHSIVERKYGLARGSVRLYVHYQPSYYHFHVPIVHASQSGIMGTTVGQAHLLDDIISLCRGDGFICDDVRVALVDHWLVYSYFEDGTSAGGDGTKGWRVVSVEMYQGKKSHDVTRSLELSYYSNATTDFTIYEQAYLIPYGVTALSTTSTRLGVTPKNLIVAS
ncbi:HIT-like domain-containing protein [Pisolithus albus]|nr:HIT-like domain-containing protein [Pisolithus albus]